ncbi:unnamed protein product [Sphenostylis stenocarpa]|uniref:Uncharacterized protein n=1 Tax=Sphenostylis stenocarpa TaxID=92480 RepID=A0AA86VDL0_9FABA|nr:unnamed protein product [Sphenostylis stenocarpa]
MGAASPINKNGASISHKVIGTPISTRFAEYRQIFSLRKGYFYLGTPRKKGLYAIGKYEQQRKSK